MRPLTVVAAFALATAPLLLTACDGGESEAGSANLRIRLTEEVEEIIHIFHQWKGKISSIMIHRINQINFDLFTKLLDGFTDLKLLF